VIAAEWGCGAGASMVVYPMMVPKKPPLHELTINNPLTKLLMSGGGFSRLQFRDMDGDGDFVSRSALQCD
jgi:hypothetical protein